MANEGAEGNLGTCLSNSDSYTPSINVIWDLRRLSKSSQKKLEELKKAPAPDSKSIELEQAIIRGVSREIRRLEKEALCTVPTLR